MLSIAYFSVFKHVSLPKARRLSKLCSILLLGLLLGGYGPTSFATGGGKEAKTDTPKKKGKSPSALGVVGGIAIMGALVAVIYFCQEYFGKPKEEISLNSNQNPKELSKTKTAPEGKKELSKTKAPPEDKKGLSKTKTPPEGKEKGNKTSSDTAPSWWSSNGLYVILIAATVLIGGGASVYLYRRLK